MWEPPGKRTDWDRAGLVSLRDFATEWLEGHECARGTRSMYERTIRLHILPELGEVLVRDLDEAKVRAWWRAISSHGDSVRSLAYSRLSQICREAVAQKMLDANPCRIKRARSADTQHEVVPATPEQARAAAAAMRPEWRIAILLGAACFLRSGEVRELRRGDVDLEGAAVGYPSIMVARTVFRIGSTYSVGPVKNRKPRRVPLPPDLVPVLREHLEGYAQSGKDGLIIHRNGKHVAEQTFEAAWHRAVREAGLPPAFRFHDFRHTGLTWLAGAGATVKELMEAAGHSTPEMAMRYQHVAQGRQAMLAAAMPKVAP
jgi:integrase